MRSMWVETKSTLRPYYSCHKRRREFGEKYSNSLQSMQPEEGRQDRYAVMLQV
jgi:hypothetical protein